MSHPFAILASIAEQKINEAMARGEFDNLPGTGRPLEIEDLSDVPEDLRMAYKILKNAGCAPPDIEDRKRAVALLELMDNCPDEKERLRQARKLRLLLERRACGELRHARLEANDEYYNKILARLEKHERLLNGK